VNGAKPALTFHLSVPMEASPDALYDVLADVGTGLEWGGTEATDPKFRLLTIDAAQRPAAVGDRFSSTGVLTNGTSSDRSVVVEADPGRRFGFDTESVLDRTHGRTLRARYVHRYSIEPRGTGSVLTYDGAVYPENYTPYWMRPGMRAMARAMAHRMMRRNLENLSKAGASIGGRAA
jgi:hypothetical protein